MKNQRMIVAGRIVIPFYLEVQESCTSKALRHANEILNSKSVSVIHGDIHTWEGKELPLIARRCHIEWFETVAEDEAI